MNNTKYDVVWVPGSIFEKGHWKLIPRTGGGIGGLIVLLLILFILCVVVLVSPLIICLIGFSLVKSKRYYASIFAFLALIYLFIDYQKKWITSLIIFGTKEENFTNGILGVKYAPHFFMVNSVAFGIAVYFIVCSYFVNSTNSKEDFNYIDKDKNLISTIIGILFGLSAFYFLTSSNLNFNKNIDNNKINNTLVDSSYTIPEEVSAPSYQDNSSDTLSNQNETNSVDYSSTDENQNYDNNDFGGNSQDNIEEDNTIYNTLNIEVKPDFPGGLEKFYKFIGNNFQVPEEEELKGKIFVTFIVEKDGSLTDIKVLRDIGYGTGKEAIRVLKSCPKWYPGEQNGKKVRVLYSLPISIQSAE
jgi:hypothetical protein